MGTILRAVVSVVNTARGRSAQDNSHVQRPDRQILLHAVSDAQPITRREYRSIMTAKYAQPLRVQT